MTSSDFTADHARRQLYAIMKSDLPFKEKAEKSLALGEKYLDVENGHVTKIDQENDYWKAIASTDDPDEAFRVGLKLDLQETYCRRTVTDEGPVALHDAPNQGWADDPAFETHGLHCYHGTTITVDDSPYGTVCFVSDKPRGEPFSDDETLFAELIARMLEHEIQRDRTTKKIEQLDQFANVVSHDLRNPLNVAQIRVDLERSNRDSEHLEIADDALDRMDTLISDVLTIARQGHDIEETETISLETMVEKCWESVQTDAATVDLSGNLRFKADIDRLKHLFENLFRNAVEHAGKQTIIRVGPLSEDDGFYIEDNGGGIPESDRDCVFDAGYTTGKEGIGLGLSIVDGIVSAHNWNITISESSTGGVRFEITDVVVF